MGVSFNIGNAMKDLELLQRDKQKALVAFFKSGDGLPKSASLDWSGQFL